MGKDGCLNQELLAGHMHIFHWKWNQSMEDDEQGIHANSQSSSSSSKTQVISS